MEKKKQSVLIPVLAVALAFALAAAGALSYRSRSYAARLREVYDGALLSALRQMEDMQLSLSKALLSADAGASHQYLNAVSSGAAQVQRSLSLLPLSHTATQSAVKLANQLSDYTAVLLAGEGLTQEDARQIDGLIAACEQYAQALYAAREALSLKAAQGTEGFYAPAPEDKAYDSAVSYPTLIYDGPFSDARTTGNAKALGDKAFTWEEAFQAAREFVGPDRVLTGKQGADMGGSIACYGVTLQLPDLTLEAAVTRQGGKILWMAPHTADFAQQKSVEECREAARAFLESRGFEGMQPTYFQVYQGVAVLSFAATQGDVLLYPDLIKVQLRLDTAQVVGIEARNYLQNHRPRGVLTPALTLEEAQGAVSSRLEVDQARLCLIPQGENEILCYEFKGQYNGHTYLCYIDAATGRQAELLKVIEGETGLATA